jgi:hypothetical protein
MQNGGRGGWNGAMGAGGAPGYKPGAVWVLRANKPARVSVMAGLSDGTATEVRSDDLKEGDSVIVGLDTSAQKGNAGLTPPPGMGGPQFRGPGGRR